MKEQNNISHTVYVNDEKVGEIIHYETTGLIESWHYDDSNTMESRMFGEKYVKESLLFAIYGGKRVNIGE